MSEHSLNLAIMLEDLWVDSILRFCSKLSYFQYRFALLSFLHWVQWLSHIQRLWEISDKIGHHIKRTIQPISVSGHRSEPVTNGTRQRYAEPTRGQHLEHHIKWKSRLFDEASDFIFINLYYFRKRVTVAELSNLLLIATSIQGASGDLGTTISEETLDVESSQGGCEHRKKSSSLQSSQSK